MTQEAFSADRLARIAKKYSLIRNVDIGNLSDRLIAALASRYATIEDFDDALEGLMAAFEIAAQQASKLPSNSANEIVNLLQRVDALNDQGQLDEGWEAIQEALSARRQEDEWPTQARERLLEKGIAQAVLRADAESAAALIVEKVKREEPPERVFDALRVEQNKWYKRGRDKGALIDLEVSIALARARYSLATNSDDRGTAGNDLGDALCTLGVRKPGVALLSEAVSAYRDALGAYSRDLHPDEWAMTTGNLAGALSSLAERTGEPRARGLFADAVAAHRDALEIITRDDRPTDWAANTHGLALALQEQASRTEGPEATRLFAEAVSAYRDALEVHTREHQPIDWAGTTQNLAIALRNEASRTEGPEAARLFAEAVTAYRDALKVRTREDHPVDWAMTTQNLALALQQQASRTEGPEAARLFAEAVTAYRAALEVTTREGHPVRWAQTTQNLALALQEQASRSEGPEAARFFAEAVTAYRAALEVRTRDDQPFHWAQTQENLALCELSWAGHDTTADPRPHLDAALAHVDNALEVYDPETLPYDHGTATRLRTDILNALDALEPPA